MNINNQTEYKKSLGSRLFILLTVCMIVVAMAVPAFAANYGEWPSDLVDSRYTNLQYIVFRLPDQSYYIASLNGDLSFDSIEITSAGAFRQNNIQFMFGAFSAEPNQVWISLGNQNAIPAGYENYIVYSYYAVTDESGTVIFPTPDLGEQVTSTLPTVLSWIQQTLNALFVEGGALQGLLLLVAVPVAITFVFLGARFIRSLIWGA